MRTEPEPAAAAAYRPDIDGLRAIAVGSVVAYHIDPRLMPGGFVGVDIFYVISGFLIVGLLMRELQVTGTVSFTGFYARRIRRLWPAYCLVVISTLALGWWLLTPLGEQQALARSVLASLAFVSNVYFLNTTGGYFDQATTITPLLHTWSLSVEEQFYLICPIALLLLWKLSRRTGVDARRVTLGALAAVLVLSFTACVLMTGSDPSRAFYLTWYRAWELAAGALLAFMSGSIRARPVAAAPCLWSGLALILLSITVLDDASRFPGPAALLPVAGATLVIAGGAMRGGTLPGRLLSSPPMVWVGKLSYSWYLWHWPLLAIARTWSMGEPDVLRDAMAGGVLGLVLSGATYLLVENPVRIRKPGWFRRERTTFAACGVMAAAVAAGALALGLQARHTLSTDARSARLWQAKGDAHADAARCHGSGRFDSLVARESCIAGPEHGAIAVVVWGDSHADQLMPLFSELSTEAGVRVLQRTRAACPPLVGARIVVRKDGRTDTDCLAFNQAVLDEIHSLRRAGRLGVVLAGRWTTYTNPMLMSGAPSTHQIAHSADGTFSTLLDGTVASLREAGVDRILLVDPVPELAYAGPECLSRRSNEECSVTMERELAFRAQIHAAIARAAASPAARLWDPLPDVCADDVCAPERAGMILYRDTNHLTATFVAGLRVRLAEQFHWLSGQ